MDTIINLTPHPLTVAGVTINPSGIVARVTTEESVIGDFDGVPVVRRTFGAVEGLPSEGIACIVSAIVASAVPGRRGVFAPDTGPTAQRDEQGRIVGVTRLIAA